MLCSVHQLEINKKRKYKYWLVPADGRRFGYGTLEATAPTRTAQACFNYTETYVGVYKRFRTESITKYTLITINTR